ncbi:SCO2322 family protein [Streptomyces roseoverticillatus]|uniref:SCO2322 family protein n=1 Tax=Streptomyces roseoverticillatus TaxID=66429 RepID=A0ABV3IST5_9ACTN
MRAAGIRGGGIRGGAVAALVTVLLALLGTAPAQAAGYRYWSFWQGSGGRWAYATQGPGTARPGDGDVIGFRFAVSADSSDAAKPRATGGFGAVCDSTPAKDGAKRVAVVLDFGTPADAPDGETPPAARSACAQVGEDATAGEALAAVAKPLRYDSSALLCAIAGYPRTGCGEQVSGQKKGAEKGTESASPKPAAESDDEGGGVPSAGLLGGIAAVVVLGAAAFWQARRRRG